MPTVSQATTVAGKRNAFLKGHTTSYKPSGALVRNSTGKVVSRKKSHAAKRSKHLTGWLAFMKANKNKPVGTRATYPSNGKVYTVGRAKSGMHIMKLA